MGEYAEMMLDGTCCNYCGEYLGSDNGYPTSCRACTEEGEPVKKFLKEKQINQIIESLCNKVMKDLNSTAFFPGLTLPLHNNIKGILSKFYLDEEGVIRNDGWERTIENNKKSQAKKKQRSNFPRNIRN